MKLALIGMAGAGKSFIGERLARRLKLAYIDIDREMEAGYGLPLQKILDALGDEKFIEEEGRVLTVRMAGKDDVLISTGGSIIYNREAIRWLHRSTIVVYLRVPFEIIENRIDGGARGIVGLKGRSLREIYEERVPLYEALAMHTVDAGNEPETVIQDIVERLF